MQSSTVETVPTNVMLAPCESSMLGAQPHILQSNRGTNDKNQPSPSQQCLLVNHKQQPQLEQLKNKIQKQH